MAHVAVDTNLWDTPEAIALGDALRDRDAWRYLIRIWAWGIDSDNASGRVVFDAKRLKNIAFFDGNEDEFLAALVSTGWLKPTSKGGYRIRGWGRNKRFFKQKEQARERQRRYREKRDNDRDVHASRNASRVRDVLPDPSPSPSPTPPLAEAEQQPGVPVLAPVRLGPETDAWSPGADIVTVGDFLEAVGELRGGASGWSPTDKLQAVLRGGPVERWEYEPLISQAASGGKGPSWVAAALHGKRTDAQQLPDAPPRPKTDAERIEEFAKIRDANLKNLGGV